jgi:2-polyprenyl-6-methoxyphenol hydroxylase-like FAD-dependent oxidoreductase
MSRKAIIVGGGIGGLAVARALLRAGWDVTVYEEAPAFGYVGAGITLAPNAVRALSSLGLEPELRSRGMAHGPTGIRTASGRWLMRIRIEELEQRFGFPFFALHRADLHEMLLSGATGAKIRNGHRVTTVRSAPEPFVLYEGPEGSGEDTADLIVGADGIDSVVRAALFPQHRNAAYAGYTTWRGVVPPGSLAHIDGVIETWGRGQRFGILPLSGGQINWYAPVSAAAGSYADGTIRDLVKRYEEWHEPIPTLLQATPSKALLKHDIYYLADPLPQYYSGHVALLGDAAHAMTPDLGQGACLALEDSVTLGVLISQNPDLSKALPLYDDARKRRTQRLARISTTWGRVAQYQNPISVTLRNNLVGLAPPSLFLRMTDSILNWQPPDAATSS